MEQKFSNNSLDLETLREFCKREGEAVTYLKGYPARWFAFVTKGCIKYTLFQERRAHNQCPKQLNETKNTACVILCNRFLVD